MGSPSNEEDSNIFQTHSRSQINTMFLRPHVSSDLPTESTLPDAPPELEDRVAILVGGFSPFFPNSPSTEAFPSAGCLSLPALPQFRGGHALFLTAEENPSIVAGGGADESGYFHPACPVFDLGSQRWEEGRIPPLLLPRVGLAVGLLLSGSCSLSARKSRTFNFLAGDRTDLCCGLAWIFNTSLPFIRCYVYLSMVPGYLGGDCPRYGWLRGEGGTRLSEA